ncbi:anion exchange protein 3 isoform X3 [Hermetia illucens]|nr:anion exchange protein 3 isoform X3 [Hermetia illucens]XP_037904874.1 anion exchange protein 3 isoform X3 [Hermetia illucens]XP_037904875.1 anion exchange protein 3 isoform X3 [Hermetia illucens]
MEKVFGGKGPNQEKFDVSSLSDLGGQSSSSNRNYLLKKSLRPAHNGGSRSGQQQKNITRDEIHDERDEEQPEDSPLVSQRAEYGEHSDSSDERKRVQFSKPSSPTSPKEVADEESDRFDERKRRRSRHQYFKHRKYSHQESVESRKVPEPPSDIPKISIQPEDSELEAKKQQEADLNELTSHRSEDPRGMRRHKIHHSSGKHKDFTISVPPTLHAKKSFDHSPHEVFVQLDELIGTGEDREWKETARWIKYEEHIEEGSDRWGKPHVASLSFHSLLNLRRCLETGVVLLDLEEKDQPAVAYRIVEQMVVEELITADDKPTVMRALLLRHRHVNDSHGAFAFAKRKYSSYTSLQYLWTGDDTARIEGAARSSVCSTQSSSIGMAPIMFRAYRRHSTMSYISNLSDDKKPRIIPASEINGGNRKTSDFKIEMRDDPYSSSQEDLKKLQNDTILRRIPHGAEATTVLVGAVDFLKQPTIAFVRLAEGIPMPSITEVPIPVRFLFILLGPRIVDLDYHEVGRSIATLMANEHFHEIAYKADDRKELLSAINEFLDDSIVLPPGNWDRHDLLPFDELKAKKDWIRSRKTKALETKQKSEKVTEEKPLIDFVDDKGKKPPLSPLEKTHKLWGGLRNDLKRRLPMYKSDILDGINSETLAAAIFMYFAALSTAITFGGLASDKTHNLMGISETLLATSLVGLIFVLVAGQPLCIIGTTGPLLLFDEALFKFCNENDFNFLSVRAYVGIWLIIIGLTISAFEGSVYVRLFTRFTQEIFSALITLIYIMETLSKLITVYKRQPLLSEYIYKIDADPEIAFNETKANGTIVESAVNEYSNTTFLPSRDDLGMINQPNTALFCTILTLGTFTVAYYLKIFRNSTFLGRSARRALGDFGVPIAIAIFVLIDYLIPQVYTEKLTVPEGISPSEPTKRGWLVALTGVPAWLPFVAGIPALLVYILIFMETHITELIVDKPERGLKKGSGLHLDIVLLCILNSGCGFFGAPWHCAATVRSIAHVSAVTIMSRTHAPGESARIIGVKEQRLSAFVVSVMVGVSVTMAPLLRLIPMAVLFGVFLYMGIASMSGVQFFDRVCLFFMPVKHHPPVPYVKRVPTWKMHLFTAVQVCMLAILWTVKSTKISLAFPFFLIMMVPVRIKLANFFTANEVDALDGNQPQGDAEDEPDFYEQAPIPA